MQILRTAESILCIYHLTQILSRQNSKNARHPKVEEEGFVLYYRSMSFYLLHWIVLSIMPRVVKKHHLLVRSKEKGNNISLKVIHVIKQKSCTERSGTGDNVYALFRDGRFRRHREYSLIKFRE